ncbi:hypothetical protein GOBAR_AA03029 [Gossypium barbadense]|uniref:Uncharacterized protein n=1 Tax=Gossypium barbadense TaxID=3634 RepID=A0A2P5YPN8_GOSBA|nr:hypothetical protein GOBAR_AA03029 [Gossypium barbadense]
MELPLKVLVTIVLPKMGLDNGSTATLMLPSGLITSYKAPMWHGSTVELLHTSVSEGDDGEAVIQGGVSLALNYEDDNEVPWSPSTWVLRDIRGNSKDSIKVELISRDTDNMVETRHIVTLGEDILTSEISVTNSNSSPLQWTGSIISHLTVSSPEATYALGLEGSNFHNVPPFLSNFGIIPSDLDEENDSEISQLWKQMGLKGIYTCAPRFFTLIDRIIYGYPNPQSEQADVKHCGRRNSVVVGRDGFDEVYMYSPGSSHEIYGEYSFICVGQSTLLKPIMLGPGEVWRGSQHLHNPNM